MSTLNEEDEPSLGCNRTIMVLKQALQPFPQNPFPCCNRTIMVLKLAFPFLEKLLPTSLQSNHYGIETVPDPSTPDHHSRCNRTIMVLKQAVSSLPLPSSPQKVAIEPLWY